MAESGEDLQLQHQLGKNQPGTVCPPLGGTERWKRWESGEFRNDQVIALDELDLWFGPKVCNHVGNNPPTNGACVRWLSVAQGDGIDTCPNSWRAIKRLEAITSLMDNRVSI